MYNTRFYETLLQVRPDDIDMFRHVHSARYIDYVLAARFDQMDRCYGNPMQAYLEKNLGWVVNTCTIRYKRALTLGDSFIVRTALAEVHHTDVLVNFEILKAQNRKLSCEGQFVYTHIDLITMRATPIQDWALAHYLDKGGD